MEPQVEIYCKKEKDKRKDCTCLWIIIAVIAILLSFFIGVLVGTLLGIIGLIGIGYVIVLVIVLAILLLIALIALWCCRKKNKKRECC